MMTDVPDRIRIRELSLDDRANLSYDLFMDWSTKGKSIAALSREYNMDRASVKTLIDEHAAFERSHGSDSKMAAISTYRFIQGKAADVLENPGNHPALVQAKAYEAMIQAQTRLDKLGGHEAPTMHGEIPSETVKDLITGMYADPDFRNISPNDTAIVMDAEVIDDDSDVHSGE